MPIITPRPAARQGAVSKVRAWLRRRRDQRILESLSESQLKDIGYRRFPAGGFGPREW